MITRMSALDISDVLSLLSVWLVTATVRPAMELMLATNLSVFDQACYDQNANGATSALRIGLGLERCVNTCALSLPRASR